MSVRYEWDVELVTAVETAEHEAGEVIDHNHVESAAAALAFAAGGAGEGFAYSIVLVRDDDNGRAWAYVEDGKLPTHFTDAHDNEVAVVPQRLRGEWERAVQASGDPFADYYRELEAEANTPERIAADQKTIRAVIDKGNAELERLRAGGMVEESSDDEEDEDEDEDDSLDLDGNPTA
jgi:hypothetical protein